MRTYQPDPIKTATIIRAAVLFIALLNQMLVAFGYSPLPIDDSNAEIIVSSIFTGVAALITWWKNNPWTRDARIAEKLARQEGLKK